MPSKPRPLPWEDSPENAFTERVEPPPIGGLHPAQQHVADNRARFTVIAAGRRFGKTFFSVKLACHYARMTHDAEGRDLTGANVWYISPTMDLALETVAPMILEELGEECVRHHKVQNYFELANGCKIYLKSAYSKGGDSLRGRALRFCVLDEISIMRPEIWELIVRPMLVDKQGHGLIIGTPVSRGKLYELHTKAKNDKTGEWAAFTYKTTDNPLIDAKEVASAASGMSKAAYKQEFEASFSTGGGHVFRGSSLQAGGLRRGVFQMAVVFGSDDAFANNSLAVSGSESAIVVVCMHPAGWTVVTAQTGYWSVSQTVKRIGKLWKQYNPRFFAVSAKDKKASQGLFHDYFKRHGIRPRSFEVYDGEATDRIKWALQERLKSKRIWARPGRGRNTLMNQLQDFPLEYANSELVQALSYIDQLPQPNYTRRERSSFRALDQVAGY